MRTFKPSGIALSIHFYESENVCGVARELLGKVLCSRINGSIAAGMIVETEAYKAPKDKASHAFGGNVTPRNKPMFGDPGYAYVYLCYGIHHLFNVVTGPSEVPHAVLIRGIEPLVGIEHMMNRRNMEIMKRNLMAGPGLLAEALGIRTAHTGRSITHGDGLIWIEKGKNVNENNILATPRVGMKCSPEWALKPWRYRIKNNKWTSPAK